MGMCFGCFYPLLLALPNEFNLTISVEQGANILLFGCAGEAGVSVLIGYAMKIFDANYLFYGVTCFTGVMLIGIRVIIDKLNAKK